MPTTRRQAAIQEAERNGGTQSSNDNKNKEAPTEVGEKRDVDQTPESVADEPPTKKTKIEETAARDDKRKNGTKEHKPQTGTII